MKGCVHQRNLFLAGLFFVTLNSELSIAVSSCGGKSNVSNAPSVIELRMKGSNDRDYKPAPSKREAPKIFRIPPSALPSLIPGSVQVIGFGNGVMPNAKMSDRFRVTDEGIEINVPKSIDPESLKNILVIDLNFAIENSQSLVGKTIFSPHSLMAIKVSKVIIVDSPTSGDPAEFWVEGIVLRDFRREDDISNGKTKFRLLPNDFLFLQNNESWKGNDEISSEMMFIVAEDIRPLQGQLANSLIRGIESLSNFWRLNSSFAESMESQLESLTALQSLSPSLLKFSKDSVPLTPSQIETLKRWLGILKARFDIDLVQLGVLAKNIEGATYFLSELNSNRYDPLKAGRYSKSLVEYLDQWLFDHGLNEILEPSQTFDSVATTIILPKDPQIRTGIVPLEFQVGSQGNGAFKTGRIRASDEISFEAHFLSPLQSKFGDRFESKPIGIQTQTTDSIVSLELFPANRSHVKSFFASLRTWFKSTSGIRTRAEMPRDRSNKILVLRSGAADFEPRLAKVIRYRAWVLGYLDFIWLVN